MYRLRCSHHSLISSMSASCSAQQCWRPSFCCGWCSTMEQSVTWYPHNVTVPSWKHFYLDSQIPLFCLVFSLWSLRFSLGHVIKFSYVCWCINILNSIPTQLLLPEVDSVSLFGTHNYCCMHLDVYNIDCKQKHNQIQCNNWTWQLKLGAESVQQPVKIHWGNNVTASRKSQSADCK